MALIDIVPSYIVTFGLLTLSVFVLVCDPRGRVWEELQGRWRKALDNVQSPWEWKG